MFSTTIAILLALVAVALLLHAVGMWSTFRHLARDLPGVPDADLPPVTLLKPLKGLEEELEANLRSFFEQDYPAPLQFVFASTEENDPAMQTARRLAGEYPERQCDFVLSSKAFGLNPKVANLQGALDRAVHDLILQSDANVRVERDHLRKMVGEFLADGAALSGSLIVGIGERSLGATLENIQITTFTAPGCCMAKEMAGIQCIIGKAMLFRRSELEAIGGLARVRNILAEDYVLGQLYEEAGRRVLLSRTRVHNVNKDIGMPQFLARHSRWLKMRAVISVPGFVADLLGNPTIFAVLAWLASGFDPRLFLIMAAVVLYKGLWDQRTIERFRGHAMSPKQRLWAPLRDLCLPALWLHALFSRSIDWRGERLWIGPGSTLTREPVHLPLRLARRVGFRR